MFYALAVQQMNVRAFYCKLDGIASPLYNIVAGALGLVACLVLPFIYYWDEYWSVDTHDTLALTFFFTQTGYLFLIASCMNNNITKFPVGDRTTIQNLQKISYATIAALATFMYFNIYAPTDIMSQAITEWVCVAFMLFWVLAASFESDYYDSVHRYGKVVSPEPAELPVNQRASSL